MKQMMYLGFIPLKLSTSWDHVNINLAKVTNELFGAKYVETVKIKVSFCRLQLPVHVHTHSPYRLISTLFLSDSSKLSNTEGVFHRQALLSQRAVECLQEENFTGEQSSTQ